MDITWGHVLIAVIIFLGMLQAKHEGKKEERKSLDIEIKIDSEKALKDIRDFNIVATGIVDALIARVELLQSKIKETNETITGGHNG